MLHVNISSRNFLSVYLKLTVGGHNYTGNFERYDNEIQLSPRSTDVYAVSCINPLDDLDILIDLTCQWSTGVMNRSVGVNSVQVDVVRVSRANDGEYCDCRATGHMDDPWYSYGASVKFVYSECILYKQVSLMSVRHLVTRV